MPACSRVHGAPLRYARRGAVAHWPAGWSCLPIDAASAVRPGYALEGGGWVDAVASKPGVAKKCCRLRDGSYAYVCSKGGATVNTTLCRTHGLKSGDRRRPETERQGPHRALTRLSCGVQRDRYTQWDRPSSSIRLSGPPGVVTCASSLRCELHSRLQSPRVTAEGLSTNLLRDKKREGGEDR